MDIGETLELKYAVGASDLAKALSLDPQDDFPEVFATSRMVALMELAAARLMKPLLSTGELSVGVNVNVNHLAATPIDVEIRAVATFLGMEGKLFKFGVALFDPAGEAGNGTHTRAIVKTERLVLGAAKRAH